MDDGEAAGGAGERDVERAQALGLLRDDADRFDDHDGVELKALHETDGHEVHLGIDAGTLGLAEVDTRRPQRVTDGH